MFRVPQIRGHPFETALEDLLGKALARLFDELVEMPFGDPARRIDEGITHIAGAWRAAVADVRHAVPGACLYLTWSEQTPANLLTPTIHEGHASKGPGQSP